MRRPGVNKPLAIAYGTGDLPAMIASSRDYHAYPSQGHLPGDLVPAANTNHYTILNEPETPDSVQPRAVLQMVDTKLRSLFEFSSGAPNGWPRPGPNVSSKAAVLGPLRFTQLVADAASRGLSFCPRRRGDGIARCLAAVHEVPAGTNPPHPGCPLTGRYLVERTTYAQCEFFDILTRPGRRPAREPTAATSIENDFSSPRTRVRVLAQSNPSKRRRRLDQPTHPWHRLDRTRTPIACDMIK